MIFVASRSAGPADAIGVFGGKCMRIRGKLASGVAVSAAVVIMGLGLSPVIAGPAGAVTGGTLRGNGSVDEAWLTGAGPGDHLTLMQHRTAVSNPANPGTADSLGSLIIRNLTPGPGYFWADTTTGQRTPSFVVLAPGHNPGAGSSLYTRQPLHQGLNYITIRDGIQLAATVRFPYQETCSAASPCPTVIEYSGYDVAGPTDPIPALLAEATGAPCTGCGDPNLLPDSATDVGAVLARVAGFATVSLQMRGTGCSAARSISSATRPTTTPTTPSRSPPISRGWPITRWAWSASATRGCRSSRRPAPIRPAWPPSPR